jgi:hypothetical protein
MGVKNVSNNETNTYAMCALSAVVWTVIPESTKINFNILQFHSRYLVNEIALLLVFTTEKNISCFQVLNYTLHPSYNKTEYHLAGS